MNEGAGLAVAGAGAMWCARELWSIGKTLMLDRRASAEKKAERHELKIAEVDRRFAELAGQLAGLEIRLTFIQRDVAALEKIKSDLNAAHEKIRELARDRAKPHVSTPAAPATE